MSQLGLVPIYRTTDSDNVIIPNGRLYTFLTGTLTPLETYTTADLSVSHGPYVQADSAGLLPPFYLDPTALTRAQVRRAPYTDAVAGMDFDPINFSLDALGVIYVPDGTGTADRDVQDKLRETVSTSDKSGALLAQLTALGTDFNAGGFAHLPAGSHALSSNFTFAGTGFNLRGDGPLVSVITFDPVSAAIAFTLNTAGSGGQYRSSLKDLGFDSSNSVNKTALKLVNVGNVHVERVSIVNWLGTGSIGILTAGRQFVRIRDCEITCARPIVIDANATHPTLAGDYFTIQNCELTTNLVTGSAIEVLTGAVLTNMAVRDTALVGGKYGYRSIDTTSTGVSYNLEFENIRREQAADATGWSFDIESTAQAIQSILFKNVRCDSLQNGIKIRNGLRITLINVDIDADAARTALDITFVPGTILTIIGGWNQAGGTVTLTNAKKVFGIGSAVGGGFGPIEVWAYDTGLVSDNCIFSDKATSGVPTTVADDASLTICDDTFCGYVDIICSANLAARYFLSGSSHTVSERDDPGASFVANTGSDGSVNVNWHAGSSRYILENRLGFSYIFSVVLSAGRVG